MNKFRKLGFIHYNSSVQNTQFIVEPRFERRAAYRDLSVRILRTH